MAVGSGVWVETELSARGSGHIVKGGGLTYKGAEEEMVVVGGGGVIEESGMIGVAGVSKKEVFGGCVLLSGLYRPEHTISTA